MTDHSVSCHRGTGNRTERHNNQDVYKRQTMNSALKGIVAGVMMAGISTVLTFLGF